MHVAAQPVELGDDDRALAFACRLERAPKLRSPIKCIGPIARLDLDERLASDLDLDKIRLPLGCARSERAVHRKDNSTFTRTAQLACSRRHSALIRQLSAVSEAKSPTLKGAGGAFAIA